MYTIVMCGLIIRVSLRGLGIRGFIVAVSVDFQFSTLPKTPHSESHEQRCPVRT